MPVLLTVGGLVRTQDFTTLWDKNHEGSPHDV
jgi:hypothetical protein